MAVFDKKKKNQRKQGGVGGAGGTAGADASGTGVGPSKVSFAESNVGKALGFGNENHPANTVGPGSNSYKLQTDSINDANGQNTSLGYIPNTKAVEDTYTQPFREETETLNIVEKPVVFDSQERSGVLNPTSINSEDTSFSVNKLIKPLGDGTTHNLELTDANGNIQQGTVSANVANRLGKGTGSFTQLDPGVEADTNGLFGRPNTSPSTVGSTQEGGLSFADRARRSLGEGQTRRSNEAARFMRSNRSALNSSNPFKRAAANRQLKMALAIDANNNKVNVADTVANTSRSNTIDNVNQRERESLRGSELASARQLAAFLKGSQPKPLTASEKLAQSKDTYSRNKDINKLVNDSANLKVQGLAGLKEASPRQKLDNFAQALAGRDIGDLDVMAFVKRVSPEASEIYSDTGISSDEKFNRLRELGLGSENNRMIHKEYLRTQQ